MKYETHKLCGVISSFAVGNIILSDVPVFKRVVLLIVISIFGGLGGTFPDVDAKNNNWNKIFGSIFKFRHRGKMHSLIPYIIVYLMIYNKILINVPKSEKVLVRDLKNVSYELINSKTILVDIQYIVLNLNLFL